MPATTTTTFEYVIKRHRSLLATMLDKKIKKTVTAGEFIDHVDSAVHLLSLGGFRQGDREVMQTALTYLSDAYQLEDGDPVKTVLLDKASDYLDYLDESDFIC